VVRMHGRLGQNLGWPTQAKVDSEAARSRRPQTVLSAAAGVHARSALPPIKSLSLFLVAASAFAGQSIQSGPYIIYNSTIGNNPTNRLEFYFHDWSTTADTHIVTGGRVQSFKSRKSEDRHRSDSGPACRPTLPWPPLQSTILTARMGKAPDCRNITIVIKEAAQLVDS